MAVRAEDIDLAADRALVERWQAGEHEAFDDLYTRYFDRLVGFCQRRVGSRDAAEEIAQEAFVKALQALPRFAGERRFYPWMTVIASRLCVDHHRRLGRVRPSDDIDPGSVDGDHGARLAFLADVDNLDRALQRLGPRHLEVLELRERREMSYAQIAEHLGVPQSTVEALLFRARKALRREFMAVSGEGKLAALPLVGFLVRKATALRDRVAEAMPHLAQLVAPVGASAAAVAALAAAPLIGDGSSPRDTVIATGPTTVASTSEPTAIAAPVVVSEPTADAAPTAPPRRLGVRQVSESYAETTAAAMPVKADAGPVLVGIDPDVVLGWVLEPVVQIGEELP